MSEDSLPTKQCGRGHIRPASVERCSECVQKWLAENKEKLREQEKQNRKKRREADPEAERERLRLKAIKWRSNNRDLVRSRDERYRKKNNVELRARRNKYRSENSDKVKAQRAKSRDLHRTELAARQKIWRAEHPDLVKQSIKNWITDKVGKPIPGGWKCRACSFTLEAQPRTCPACNNRRTKIWRSNHPQNAHQRRVLHRGTGVFTKVDLDVIWKRQKKKCAVSGCQFAIAASGKNKYHIDHIRAICNGGGNEPENIQILCATHNLQKSKQDEYLWANEHGLLFPK